MCTCSLGRLFCVCSTFPTCCPYDSLPRTSQWLLWFRTSHPHPHWMPGQDEGGFFFRDPIFASEKIFSGRLPLMAQGSKLAHVSALGPSLGGRDRVTPWDWERPSWRGVHCA